MTMRKSVLGVTLAAGMVLAAPAAKAAETWQMQSTFPGTLVQLGTAGQWIAQRITLLTNGKVTVEFQNPGAVVPALQTFDAVSSGAVKAGWSTPGYWAGKVPALQFFSSVPFGPEAGEYLAWMKFGGGEKLMDELYEKHNIKSLICAAFAPEASGWFRREIKTVDDLKGLKMRFFGLGAKVMEKMGVSTQLLAGGDIFPALERGTIDATEFSMPALDLNLGFFQVAKHYYFPGWHQQATLFDLMINLDAWEKLDELTQLQISTACQANVARTFAEGEAIQFDAIKQIKEKGVTIHKWPKEILDAFQKAWGDVLKEESAKDADFDRVAKAYLAFRENYKVWNELAFLR